MSKTNEYAFLPYFFASVQPDNLSWAYAVSDRAWRWKPCHQLHKASSMGAGSGLEAPIASRHKPEEGLCCPHPSLSQRERGNRGGLPRALALVVSANRF
jgi:hypothetical protein